MPFLLRSRTRRCLRYAVFSYVTISVVLMVGLLPPSHSNRRLPIQSSDRNSTEKMVALVKSLPETSPQINSSLETRRTVWSKLGASGKYAFEGTFEENLQKLKSLQFTESEFPMDNLGFNRAPTQILNTSLPVLVTGADSKFFNVAQGLIKTIHEKLLPKYPDLKFVLYDMGFTQDQHQRAVKYCRCEVRKLPFQDLPNHVRRLGNFAFKPIIANYIFQEFGHVWWVDSSVRFMSNDLEDPVKYLNKNGALFFTYGPILNVALHTHKNMFRKFEEDPRPYMNFGEVEAGNVAFTNNEVGRVILNRWVSCALDASCLTPAGSIKACRSPKVMKEENIGACHRFDQSALSIILRRLYHKQNDYPLVDKPFKIIQVIRGQAVHYFPPK